MSKIQKAIREIERSNKSAKPSSEEAQRLGTLVAERRSKSAPKDEVEPRHHLEELGEETRQIAALDETKILRRVVVDRPTLRAAGFIAPENEERVLIDQYRQIKRPLVAHAFGKRATKIEDGHLILVTSAMAGDGKTFSCINLALSLARESDKSVLLIDADTAKAHISNLFGIHDQAGLLDLLEKGSKLDLQDTIIETDVPDLSIMAAGKLHAHSTELLASNRMEKLIKALSAQDPNRIVIFDSSPLLSTSESRVMATLVGQVVMIVCAGKTPRPAVEEAVALISEDKALNLVLNRARGVDSSGYYGGYYGHGSDARAGSGDGKHEG